MLAVEVDNIQFANNVNMEPDQMAFPINFFDIGINVKDRAIHIFCSEEY